MQEPAATPAPAPVGGAPAPETIKQQVIDVLHTLYDPEIPVNIYDLGLIYGVDVSPERAVHVRMTLTSPGCPAATTLPPLAESKAKGVAGVTAAKVEVVWDPPWKPEMMSEVANVALGMNI
jgi:FeS assembly SUF system protein